MGKKNNEREYKYVLDEYNSAITLLEHQANLMWQENSAFLLAVTVLLGFIGTGLIDDNAAIDRQKYVLLIGSILGLILSGLWFVTFHHNYPYHRLRVFQARKLERDLGFTLFKEGNLVYKGKVLEFECDEVKMNSISRWLHPSKAFSILILLFVVAFSFLIIYTIVWI